MQVFTFVSCENPPGQCISSLCGSFGYGSTMFLSPCRNTFQDNPFSQKDSLKNWDNCLLTIWASINVSFFAFEVAGSNFSILAGAVLIKILNNNNFITFAGDTCQWSSTLYIVSSENAYNAHHSARDQRTGRVGFFNIRPKLTRIEYTVKFPFIIWLFKIPDLNFHQIEVNHKLLYKDMHTDYLSD